MIRIWIFALGALVFTCCNSESRRNGEAQGQNSATIPVREYSVGNVLWQQKAAEKKALCYQAYNIARIQLDNVLSSGSESMKPYAIVADLDETVLDNSFFNAKLIQNDEEYTQELWEEWVILEKTEILDGAEAFFRYAESKGVETFYVSNRLDRSFEATISNLKKFDLPYLDRDHILLKTTSSGKESRRQEIKEKHHIIMLLGDNLSDFSMVFDNQNTVRRNLLVDSLMSEFGQRFIVFPNPMYGDWETKGIYEGIYNWTATQKDSLRKAKLKGF